MVYGVKGDDVLMLEYKYPHMENGPCITCHSKGV